MKGKPDLRLMARAGMPVANLLLARRVHQPPSVWTVLDYGILVAVSLATMGAAIYGASVAMDMFRL